HGGFFNDEAAIAAVFEENLPAMLYLARYAVDHPLAPLRRLPVRRDRDGGSPARPGRPIIARPAPGPVR
ncbi:MAG: hypothetical protein H6P95_1357, partial [Candidatus Aminicenantes bacterium]|nr:hypothetical protein [Candidatus Aminicenantes bacterium]